MAEAVAAPRGLLEVPVVKQAFLLVGLAAAIAAALWLVLWSQGSAYAPLYSQLSERETAQVVDALTGSGIPYRLDASGAVTVPEPRLREARMKLAAQGLPQSDALGVELIQQESGFGSSQFMEGARYQLALETELARTIVKLQGVQGARVHLALPRASAFVRDKRRATASVMLQLYSGRRLEPGQVSAIVHLVASSIPDLQAGDVTVVDQNGSLLSSPDGGDPLSLSAKQLEYTRAKEQDYVRRIEQILAPLVGAGRMRASVAADLDFSIVERTSEDFDPAQQVVRSEQTSVDQRMAGDAAQGVPGALTNQPPQTTPLPPATAQQPAAAAAQPVATTQRATRNFEIDRTISHVKQPTGTVRRLSVAVVLDSRRSVNAEGAPVVTPLTDAELARYTALVQEAVGFDADRGDRVQVVNATFDTGADAAAIPPEPWYSAPWLKAIGRQGLAALLVLVVAFVVLRPIMKNLLAPPPPAVVVPAALPAGAGAPAELERDKVTISRALNPQDMPAYDQHLAVARAVVQQDPRRAAAVVREWVTTDGR